MHHENFLWKSLQEGMEIFRDWYPHINQHAIYSQNYNEVTEDEMAGWHHQLDGREFEWTPRDGDGQGGLACCDSWGRKESDMTEQLSWTEVHRMPEETTMCLEMTMIKNKDTSIWVLLHVNLNSVVILVIIFRLRPCFSSVSVSSEFFKLTLFWYVCSIVWGSLVAQG